MDAEMSEMGGGSASGVKRANEGISGDDFLGQKKHKEQPTGPNSPVTVLQPYFVVKDGEMTEPITLGSLTAEVFELRIKSDEKESCGIHGTVWIECEFGRQNIFERSHDNPQDVDCEKSLELTGPTRAISGGYKIFAGLDLMEGTNQLMHNDELTHEVFLIYDAYESDRDHVYSVFKNSKSNSSVKWKLRYVVYEEAVVGTIEIKFKPASSVRLCGTIYASSNMFPEWETLLFSKNGDVREFYSIEHLGEQQEEVLPLLRSVAAVPLRTNNALIDGLKRPIDGSLLIDVDLVNMDDGGVIAEGVLEFKVGNYGDYVGTISSKYGEMQVNVIFDHLDEHVRLPQYSFSRI